MDIHSLFLSCFPVFHPTAELFDRLSARKSATILRHEEDGVLLGFAMLHGEELSLLCVHPDRRRRGIGTALLARAEETIRAGGGRRVRVGGWRSAFLLGATAESAPFFEKRGYRLGEECEEMTRSMRDFFSAEFALPVPVGVTFGRYTGDTDALLRAVGSVEEDWKQYYGKDTVVFCAMLDGEIASFCQIEEDGACMLSDGKNKIGVIGCVGTVPKYRRRGIGLRMVALASDLLRERECDLCFIHYTTVAHWYAKLGYKTFLKQIFAHKDLQ